MIPRAVRWASPVRQRLSRFSIALGLYPLLVLDNLRYAVMEYRWVGLLTLLAWYVAVALRRRPLLACACMLAGAVLLRLAFGVPDHGDQLDLSNAAAERAFTGENPYGIGYSVTKPPGTPYAYGPLGLLWWLPGEAIEFAGSIGIMATLAWARAWITFSVFAAFFPVVYYTMAGGNDYSVAFLLLCALIAMRRHRLAGMALLAASAAIKPYTAAWFGPAVGFGGWSAAAVLLAVSAVLWSPVVIWGVDSYLRSVAGVEHLRERLRDAGEQNWAIADVPGVRYLSIAIALLAVAVRDWRSMVLVGCVVYVLFLGFAPWAHIGYWIALIPILGIALEGRLSVTVSPAATDQNV